MASTSRDVELAPSDPYAREAQTLPRLSDEMAARVATFGTEERLPEGTVPREATGLDCQNSAVQAALFPSRTVADVHVLVRPDAIDARMRPGWKRAPATSEPRMAAA